MGAPAGLALPALLAGATAIGFAPILVRLSDTGPIATAFWRLLLSVPVLWLAARAAPESGRAGSRDRWLILLAGAFFAADLAVWHWSIALTSVANATLLANLAPVFVALGAWWLFGERIGARFAGALALALAGAAALTGARLGYATAQTAGDALGMATAFFYAGYLLAVTRLRTRRATVAVLFGTTAAGAVALLPLALATGENLWPGSAAGWLALTALALGSHCLGQGLIIWALAHLPVTVGAIGLLWQPVAAALLAWWLFAETMGPVQLAGAVLVLAGIALARLARQPDRIIPRTTT